VRRARLSFGDLTGAFAAAVFFLAGFRADRFATRLVGRLAERAVDFFAFPAETRLPRRAVFCFAMGNQSFRTLTVCR